MLCWSTAEYISILPKMDSSIFQVQISKTNLKYLGTKGPALCGFGCCTPGPGTQVELKQQNKMTLQDPNTIHNPPMF